MKEKFEEILIKKEKELAYLKNNVQGFKSNGVLENRINRTKLNYRTKELTEEIKNIKSYLKRIDFVEKVRDYENNSRNS
ncbi:hypothetical protein [Haliovirga abyssi]|uniref:50S ribosomal protein L29 n=1 Tax=Haliovirga abyssi TaxID=2996794 RepID=A0AAU9DHN6_9FUSO|nr:hypothetical protein [Haliovirga abyssi]BDU50249.1 hypothetical protein HLVA_08180 [Haliovirga abyssi]